MKHFKVLMSTALLISSICSMTEVRASGLVERVIAGVPFTGDNESLCPVGKPKQMIGRALTSDDLPDLYQGILNFSNLGIQGPIPSDVLNQFLVVNDSCQKKVLFLEHNKITEFDASFWADDGVAQTLVLSITNNPLTNFLGSQVKQIQLINFTSSMYADISFDASKVNAINDLWGLKDLLTNPKITKRDAIQVDFMGTPSKYLHDLGVESKNTRIVISPDRQNIYVTGLMGDAYNTFYTEFKNTQYLVSKLLTPVTNTLKWTDYVKNQYLISEDPASKNPLLPLKHIYILEKGQTTEHKFPFIQALQSVISENERVEAEEVKVKEVEKQD